MSETVHFAGGQGLYVPLLTTMFNEDVRVRWMCLKTLRHVPALEVSGQLRLGLISHRCCAGMAPLQVAAFHTQLFINCFSWALQQLEDRFMQ